MNLSDRVWRLTNQFKSEMELALELGLGEGKSAAALSRDVRQYLNEPHRLFRRVRDEKGQLRLSKAATAYHPGQGVYRSSYKNALRLTATENNMAYRTADHERWNDLDFVIGMEIKLSGNHPIEDICDEMCGVYPKTFKFVGWHPFCRCYAVPKLADEDEFIARQQALIDGNDTPQGTYTGEVTEMPQCFTDWVQHNAERIETAKNEPYFIKDNRATIDGILHPATAAQRTILMGTPVLQIVAKNNEALAKALGLTPGEAMSFEEANEMRGNPNYKKAAQFRSNCQSSVLANEMRRRGFDVEAYGNSKKEWYMPTILAKKPEIAFIGADGNPPIPKGILFNGDLLTSLRNEMKETGRYHLRFRFENNCGHIITAERLADGSLRIYDPQSGKLIKDFTEFASKVNPKSLEYYRVDNLEINPGVARGVVKARGAKGDAPRMQLPEIQSALEKGWYGDYKPEYKPLTSPELKKRLSEARSKQEKMKIFNDLIRNEDFVPELNKEQTQIFVHLGHKTKDAYWPDTKRMGFALSKSGRDVIFLPESDSATNADAIMMVKGYPRLVDFKYSASTSWNTLQQHLAEGFSQADTIALKLENMDAGQFRDAIEYMKRNGLPIGNIILLNQYDNIIELNAKDLGSRKYRQKIRGFLK